MAESINVLFEDKDLLVINKPSGIHSVISTTSTDPSVAAWLKRQDPEVETVSDKPEDCGLVNRLDYFTSGCLLAAKNRNTWEDLRSLLKKGEISKSYLALQGGQCPKFQIVDNYIGHPNRRAAKVRVFSTKPRKKDRALPARSEFSTVFFSPELDFSLVRVKINTARRHQIRVHSAFTGHPLVGDSLYGSERILKDIIDLAEERSFFLLAETISFTHPRTGVQIKCQAALPESLAKIVTKPYL